MSSSTKFIKLKSGDGETFDMEEAIACQAQTLKHMIEDHCADSIIPVPNVSGEILKRVIDYCNKHGEVLLRSEEISANKELKVSLDEELRKYDEEFLKVDQSTLFDLIMASNYLEIQTMLDLTCQAVADMIKGKKPEEIRTMFNIKNDFSPEEEAELLKENSWAFE